LPYTSITVNGITLLCFPPGDDALRGLALRMAGEQTPPSPESLEAALRNWYPNLIVRPRHELATFDAGAGSRTWYVYRDGRFSPFAPDGEWWLAASAARLVIAEDRRYVDGNDAALELLNVTLDELRRHRPGDFTSADASPSVPWVFKLLEDSGVLHSTAVLMPAGDRPPVGVEYRMVRNGDGPGRHVSWLRKIPLSAAADEPADSPAADYSRPA
jgi:hypothetical protein